LWLAVPLLAALPLALRVDDLAAALARIALFVFLAIGVATTFHQQRRFFAHSPGEGGRWVIDNVRPYVPPGAVVVVDWTDATSLAYGAYVDGSLPGRIIVSGFDPDKLGLYRRWANDRPVFLLLDPNDVDSIAGAQPPIKLDDYHELFELPHFINRRY
jgi:hypothetical protein